MACEVPPNSADGNDSVGPGCLTSSVGNPIKILYVVLKYYTKGRILLHVARAILNTESPVARDGPIQPWFPTCLVLRPLETAQLAQNGYLLWLELGSQLQKKKRGSVGSQIKIRWFQRSMASLIPQTLFLALCES